MVAAAVQSGELPHGIDRLKAMLDRISKDPKAQELVPYVKFRTLAAEYGQSLATAKDGDHGRVQDKWIKDLEEFVNGYPTSEETSEALLQLGLGLEFAGREDDAAKAYGKIVTNFSNAEQAKKAAGAKFRLESVGKTLSIQSKTTDGQAFDLEKFRGGGVVLIQYWATWCDLCKQDMTQIRALQSKYGPKGFRVVGINLDQDSRAVGQFLTAAKLTWPQLYESGGMDSRLANQMGIQTLPTMILIDKTGHVVRRNVHASELEAELGKLMK
jgi:thiol-disulfide isomerase/thioredoxin